MFHISPSNINGEGSLDKFRTNIVISKRDVSSLPLSTFVKYSCGESTITCQIREQTRGVRVQAEPVTTGVVGSIIPEKDSESGLGVDDVGDRPLPSPPLISDYPARVQEWRMASLSFWNRARYSTVSSHAAVLPLSSALRVRSSSCLLPGCCTVI